jgi:predicted transcriptional regulator
MLDEIAGEIDVSRNALMRYAIRHFLIQYQAGEMKPSEDVEEPWVKERLKMP